MKSHSCEEGRRWEGPSCTGFFCSRGANKGQTLNDDFKKPVPYQEHKSYCIIKLEAGTEFSVAKLLSLTGGKGRKERHILFSSSSFCFP